MVTGRYGVPLLGLAKSIYYSDCVSTCIVFPKIFPLCYKQVIALSPRSIKNKFHLYFQSFHKFCEIL